MRVVSLLPAATELLAAIGVDPVAVSHECDYPPRMTDRPAVTATRIDASGAPGEVDRAVTEAAANDGVYEIHGDRLAALEPDLVVTQAVCDVCAVDHVRVREVVERETVDADLCTIDVHSLADLHAAIERLGELVDRPAAATDLVGECRERIAAVESATPPAEQGPRVAVLDWPDPPMIAGHWVPDLVEAAGGRYGLAETGDRSEPTRWADVVAYDPEVLIVAPCGYDLDRTAAHLDALTDREGWASLSAVADGRAYLFDGHHYVNRPGPRLVDACEHLAAAMHESEPSLPANVARPIAPGAHPG